ncbi:MAG TPA: hypothetical protein VI756_28650 [Blastocatellia bacterium]
MTDSESKHNVEPVTLSGWRFAARELGPLPQPLDPAYLVEGSVYFSLNYADRDRLVPILETLVFVGRKLELDAQSLLFQDIDSYREGIRYGTTAGGTYGTFQTRPEGGVTDVFGYERAVEELMRCSLRRRGLLAF